MNFKDFINKIDDPWDNFKHFVHGMVVIFGGKYYYFSAYMKSQPGTKWSIKRCTITELLKIRQNRPINRTYKVQLLPYPKIERVF